ncbi:hypothetical protein RI129_009075 [Pyrocoelia pectoralis]|uniref:Nuclear pore complex protein Nup153 n=1 Tax=Pyrocoelia pectoralis TaxID=417401 RepID=A0AAN7ZKP7_9COLE
MKLKERLQDSTVAVRQIATTSKSVLNRDDYRIRSKEEDTPKHTNKVKNKLMATRQKVDNQQVEEVKLPEVPLPITTLPKFDFSLPAPPSNAKQPLITVACNEFPKPINPTPAVKKPEATNAKDNETQFEFSNPLILADNLKSIIAINDFKFSDPVFNQKEKNIPDINLNFKTSTPEAFTLKRKNPDLPPVTFKISKGNMEEIFNKPTKESLDKFKPAADLWECSVCLIRNAPEKLKCAACETAKPDLKSVKSTNIPKVTQSFGEQFKPPSSTWECPTCLIRNKDEILKCVACETVKPGCKSTIPSGSGFGDVYKKKENEWECSVCMIRNKEGKTVCEACETPKPGEKVDGGQLQKKTDVAIFNFGIFPKTKSETKTTGNETVQTSTVSLTNTTSIATASSTIPVFSFGIPKTQTLTTKEKVVEPVLSLPKVDDSKLSLKPTEETTKPPVSSSSFTFGIPAKSSITNTVVANPVQHEANPIQPQISKPIVLSTSSSAFKFQSPTSTPSLKRTATDSEAATVESKKLSSSITFQPPTVNSLPAPPPIRSIQSPDKPLFNIVKPAISQAPTTTSSFIFTPLPPTQVAPAATTASANLFSFAAKTTSQSVFGNTVTTTQSAVFKFAQAEQATSNQPAFAVTEKQSTLPLFGPPSSNSMFGSTKSAFEVPPPPQPFGSVASGVFGSEPKPAIAFTTDSPKSQSVFGTESKPSMFGAEQKIATGFASEQSAPGFGTDQKAAAPFGSTTEQKPSIFGSDQKAQSMFGTDQKALPTFASTDAKPFTFGTAASSNETSSKPLFSFGAKSSEPSKPFSFGPTPTQTAGGFNFNSSASPAFNFNAPKVDNTLPFQTVPTASNMFNAPPVQAPPLQNGGFNFGTPTNASSSNKTGFNFGTTNQFAPAAPAPTSTAPTSTGFWGMGSNTNANPAPPVAGGFSFGQTAPPSQTPSFNANMKPNFNFTAGNMLTGFSATAESSPVPPRRRLKAVRRNPR